MATSTAPTASYPSSSGEAVAIVAGTPITKATYEHWLAVTTALSGQKEHGASTVEAALQKQVMGFIITSQWTLDEAQARGIEISDPTVKAHVTEDQKKEFKHSGELQSYLAKDHETTSDLLLRAKLELIEAAIAKKYAVGKTRADKESELDGFQTRFEGKWKAQTTCAKPYMMEDCKI